MVEALGGESVVAAQGMKMGLRCLCRGSLRSQAAAFRSESLECTWSLASGICKPGATLCIEFVWLKEMANVAERTVGGWVVETVDGPWNDFILVQLRNARKAGLIWRADEGDELGSKKNPFHCLITDRNVGTKSCSDRTRCPHRCCRCSA